jgi:nucleotide-binding universal stress UspA family protein
MANGKLKHILVAVDKFPQSKPSLTRAIELARSHKAKLTIVHIVGEFDAHFPAATEGVADRNQVEQQALLVAREFVEAAIRPFDFDGLDVVIRVEAGSASSRVAELSKKLGADLIVLKVHQRRSIREKLLGSTADRIIRAAPVSVLVVKRPVKRDYRNIVVAVDDSDSSEAAAVLSVKISPRARIQLVYVSHLSMQFEHALLRAGTSQANIEVFRRKLVTQARHRLRKLVARMEQRQPVPRTRVVEGEPASSLLQITQVQGVDLIALGPSEQGLIQRALLGSVTQNLLRNAPCDVLISRPPLSA